MNLRTAGSSTARSADTLERRRRRLTPLVIVTAAALVFAVLLILVRLQWAPLEAADPGAAADINSLIAGNATLWGHEYLETYYGSTVLRSCVLRGMRECLPAAMAVRAG